MSCPTRPIEGSFVQHEHTFRQSWLGTYFECPEQARLVSQDLYPYDQTEAAAKGTAMHAAIEAVVERCADFDSALQEGLDTFREISAEEGFRWVKVKREQTCLTHIVNGFRSWWNHVLPTLGASLGVERKFKFLFHEDGHRRIWLSGTIDYAEALPVGIKDWKLSGNRDKYTKEAWKLKRYAIQPTVYTAAAYELGWAEPDQAVPFQWVAMSPTRPVPDLVDTERDVRHVNWLRRQCISIAKTIEKNLDEWPLRDQSALCSPDWCTAWRSCKGAVVDIAA